MESYKFLNILKEVTKFGEYYNEENYTPDSSSIFQINPEDKHFDYLFKNNKLLKLYEFVQNDNSAFIKFQKEYNILWGLFAFIDTQGIYKNKIRYLFAPYDEEIGDLSLHPHLLFKVFGYNPNEKNLSP